MENKLPIWQTTKDSFKFVYHHYMNWMRLASGPFVIIVLAAIFVLAMGGTATYMMTGQENALAGMEVEAMGAGIGVFAIAVIANLIAFLMFSVNGYRYVMYNEGGHKWIEFRFDHYMWKVFLFSLLVVLILALVGGVVGGVTALVHMLDMSFLTVLVGAIGALAVIYLALRMMFVIPFAAIGMEKPIKYSMELAKGRVLRLFGLIFLVSLLVALITFVVMFIVGLIVGLMAAPGASVMMGIVSGLIVVSQALMNLFGQAVTFTALIMAYKHIAGK